MRSDDVNRMTKITRPVSGRLYKRASPIGGGLVPSIGERKGNLMFGLSVLLLLCLGCSGNVSGVPIPVPGLLPSVPEA